MLESKTGIASSKKAHEISLRGKSTLGYTCDYTFNREPKYFFKVYASSALNQKTKNTVYNLISHHRGVVNHRSWFKVLNPMIINVLGTEAYLLPCNEYGEIIDTNLPIKRHTIDSI